MILSLRVHSGWLLLCLINISLILVYSCLEVNLPDQPNRRGTDRMPGGVGGLLSDGESYPDILTGIKIKFRAYYDNEST